MNEKLLMRYTGQFWTTISDLSRECTKDYENLESLSKSTSALGISLSEFSIVYSKRNAFTNINKLFKYFSLTSSVSRNISLC